MNKRGDTVRFTRRDFLKTAGLAAGALAFASPWPVLMSERAGAAQGSASGGEEPLKISVLLPDSSIHPTMGENLLAGLSLHFDQDHDLAGGREVRLSEADIGPGQGSALRKVDELLADDAPDLAVGLVSPNLGAALHDRFEDRGIAFIALDAGANIPRAGERAVRFGNSLAYWRSSLALGAWAGENLGRRAMLPASFYESGYDAPYAFRLGFEQAGGEMLDARVTHLPHEDDSGLDSLIADIEETRPDFVYASYCGSEAVEFVRAYGEAGLQGHVPLVGSSFLTDESILAEQGAAAVGIKTCLPWAAGLREREYLLSSEAYERETGREPDAFAALGFETARMISRVLDAAGGDPRQAERFANALVRADVVEPRGRAPMGSVARGTTGPLYLREVERRDGRLVNAAVSELEPAGASEEQFADLRANLRTGWLNTYLVA